MANFYKNFFCPQRVANLGLFPGELKAPRPTVGLVSIWYQPKLWMFKRTTPRSGVYSAEDFLLEEERLNVKLTACRITESYNDLSMTRAIKNVVRLSELLKYGYTYYLSANSSEKEAIMRIVFSELSFDGDVLKFKCKNGFQALESRFISYSAGWESRTPHHSLENCYFTDKLIPRNNTKILAKNRLLGKVEKTLGFY